MSATARLTKASREAILDALSHHRRCVLLPAVQEAYERAGESPSAKEAYDLYLLLAQENHDAIEWAHARRPRS